MSGDYMNMREDDFLASEEVRERRLDGMVEYYADDLKDKILGRTKIIDQTYDYVKNFERVYRPMTAAELLLEKSDFDDYQAKVAQFFVDACKAGNEQALGLLGEIAKHHAENMIEKNGD